MTARTHSATANGRSARRGAVLLLLGVAALAAAGCRQDMHDQPKVEPLEVSDFWADRSSARGRIEHTVARGELREDSVFYTGLGPGDQFVAELPLPLTPELVERGRSRYEAFCAPCHGRQGDGRGMIVRRGFKHPASFHEARLLASPVGYYYDVVSKGFGEMSSYAAQLAPRDRWAVVAYIRALQLSRQAPADELSEEDRRRLEAAALIPQAGGGEAGEEHG